MIKYFKINALVFLVIVVALITTGCKTAGTVRPALVPERLKNQANEIKEEKNVSGQVNQPLTEQTKTIAKAPAASAAKSGAPALRRQTKKIYSKQVAKPVVKEAPSPASPLVNNKINSAAEQPEISRGEVKGEKIYSEPKPAQGEDKAMVAPAAGQLIKQIVSAPIFIAGDRLAPETELTVKPALITASSAAEFIFRANEANSVFSCQLDDSAWQSCASPKNLSGLSGGQHVFKVRAADSSGNVDQSASEYGWTVDTVPPLVALSSGPALYASSSSAGFSFAADETVSGFNCNLDESGWSQCISPMSYENLATGAHIFKVKAIDLAGNQSAAPAESGWTIDLSAPGANLVSGPAGYASSSSASFELASDDSEAAFQCQLDQAGWQACLATTTLSGLSEGWHDFRARAMDLAGNISSSTDARIWFVDKIAPVSAMSALAADYEATGFTVSWSGLDADAASATSTASGVDSYDVQYKIGAADWQDWINATTSLSSLFSLALDSGQTVYFRSRARDLAGNLEDWPTGDDGDASTTIIARHLLISEAQIAGATVNDEFIELYNPSASNFDLSSFSLQYRGSNAQSFSKRNFSAGSAIVAKGYFLIVSSQYNGSATADMSNGTFNLSGAGGTIFLVNSHDTLTNNTATSSIVIDRLAYGSGQYLFAEGATFNQVPSAGQSLERKASAAATAQSMAQGGAQEAAGNGYDSDDNSADFILRDNSQPQSSASSLEP